MAAFPSVERNMLRVLILVSLHWACASLAGAGESRVVDGLLLLYSADASSAGRIENISSFKRGVDLVRKGGEFTAEKGVISLQNAQVVSQASAAPLANALMRAGQLSLEVWMRPANLSQKGPARILTFSKNSTLRNFTLGQQASAIEVRLRTTGTSTNGIPAAATAAGVLGKGWNHVVYTRAASGAARIYINGKLVVEQEIAGGLGNWQANYQLALGDEFGGGRAWAGELTLVAVYRKALSEKEVVQNFAAGRMAASPVEPEPEEVARALFEKSIAPILADHCLECHDPASRQGGLDLSRRQFAMTGGDSGAAIVPGDLLASHLWEAIDSGEMPADRPALSNEEKLSVKQWIEAGADWSFETIDPAIYAHGGGDEQRFVQRLTVDEYVATVQIATGVDISDVARNWLPADLRADGFSNTAYNLNVSLQHVEAYARLAREVVARMDVNHFADRFTKRRKFTDKDMGALIEKMGKWLLRGPLSDREVIAYRGISTSVASAGGSYTEAVALIIEAMLQSPRFVYRVETQRGDGEQWPVSQYELAARISYILWGAAPDAELFQAADKGELVTDQQIGRHIERMLDDHRALERARQFASQWLNLKGLANLQPDAERFSDWTPELAQDMQQETLAYFEQIAWHDRRPLADLLCAPFTFATDRLARHYRFDVEATPVADDHPQAGQLEASKMRRYDFGTGDDSKLPQRGGLLTQGSVLTIGGDNASMVTRGLFVLHDLLRGVVKDPPPCVNTTPVPTRPGLTQRGIAEARIESEACGGCHEKFEPLAFGLERFDGLGSYRETDEHGNALREDGQLLVPGTERFVEYATARQLMQLLSESERVQQSISWKLMQFALARPLTAVDAPAAIAVHRASQAQGGTYHSLIKSLILSDLVRRTTTEPEPVGVE